MKKKLFNRQGAAVELAMLMIVVCFSLAILLLSTTMLLHGQKLGAKRRLEQSVALEQIGQEFLSAVVAGQVDETWLPAEDNGLTDETIHRHTWQENIIEEATCTKAGIKELTCNACGKKVTREIPVAEHQWVRNAEKSQDYEQCKSDGIYYDTCFYCGAVDITVFPAHWKGENYTVIEEATCRKEGKVSYNCADCLIFVEQITPINNDNHNWGENGKCVDCGMEKPVLPIITYSLAAYRTADKAVRYEVTVFDAVAGMPPAEPTEDKLILNITIVFDEVDGTYLVTEWTKNDRS